MGGSNCPEEVDSVACGPHFPSPLIRIGTNDFSHREPARHFTPKTGCLIKGSVGDPAFPTEISRDAYAMRGHE